MSKHKNMKPSEGADPFEVKVPELVTTDSEKGKIEITNDTPEPIRTFRVGALIELGDVKEEPITVFENSGAGARQLESTERVEPAKDNPAVAGFRAGSCPNCGHSYPVLPVGAGITCINCSVVVTLR